MIKVLLVDDEPFIRQGLRVLVDWESYGFEIAGEAANGLEAIRFLEEQPVDVVFADLKMPGMGGLEMIEKVKEEQERDIRFVILTGYADFEYAQRAIGLKVVDYMLKPIQTRDLEELLDRLEKVFKEDKKKELSEEKHERLEYYMNMSKLLVGKYTRENLEAVCQKLGSSEQWQYVSFELDASDQEFQSLDQDEKLKVQDKARDILEHMLREKARHVVPMVNTEENIYGIGLMYVQELADHKEMEEKEYILYLQRRLMQQLPYQIQAYMGMPVDSLERIAESVRSIQVSRCLHNFSEEKEPVTVFERCSEKRAVAPLEKNIIDELVLYVSENQEEKIKISVEKLYEQIRKNAGMLDMIQANIYYLWYRLIELATKIDNEFDQEEILHYISLDSFDQAALSGSAQELTSFVLEYAEYLKQIRNVETKGVMDKVEEYIHENYKENLSLKLLGEKFYINNVYLGQLFKKKYGMAFREYMNQLRIEKSARLLAETNLRIYAIAEEVGFHNADYFINKFVQLKGTTPQQYRMRHKTGV